MILFSLVGIAHEIVTLYIAYMEEGKSLLTIEFYNTWSGEWEESVTSRCYTFESLLKRLELNYQYHEIYHMEMP